MRRYWLILILLQMVPITCVAQEAPRDVILATVSYSLSKEEVARYSKEAMEGSPEAALKLANFYWMRGRPDFAKTKYWALIGAENGNAEAQFRAFQRLRTSTDRLDHRRALFWLKKAAEQSYLGADAILKSCANLSQPLPTRGAPCFGPNAEH
jgi:TPR repeat protein